MLINAARRPLPVVLDPAPDELLSSWLHRHAAFYGLTEPMLISWLRLETKKLRSLDFRPGLGQIARIVDSFRTDPMDVVTMTHTALPIELAALVGRGKPIQFCRTCCERHRMADALGAVLKSWLEAWRITCPICGSPLSEIERRRGGGDTVRNTSPFGDHWDAAKIGEELVNRYLRGEPTPLASPIAMMRLLLILNRPQKAQSTEGYNKGWLLNDIVPGFDAEALRVAPSISKGANAMVPLYLRIALLAGLAFAAKNAVDTIQRLRPFCRPVYRKRFDELAYAALGVPLEFSI